jgi:hypothetical protein
MAQAASIVENLEHTPAETFGARVAKAVKARLPKRQPRSAVTTPQARFAQKVSAAVKREVASRSCLKRHAPR